MRTSAGLLPWRRHDDGSLLVFIAHPGGPMWARKDERVWSIVKGEYDAESEEPRIAAAREWVEETGVPAPAGDWLDLGEVRQTRKIVRAFAVHSPAALAFVVSNQVEVEWPPRSGRTISVPEIDRAEWMSIDAARPRLIAAQVELLDRLAATLVP